ncbi:MAG: hypothetical protein ACP5R4_11255 [Armatimonadota bacterium]
MFSGLVHRLAERIALSKPGRLRQEFRIIVGIVAASHPKNQIFAVCDQCAAGDFSPVKPRAVARIAYMLCPNCAPVGPTSMPTMHFSNQGLSEVLVGDAALEGAVRLHTPRFTQSGSSQEKLGAKENI